MDTYYLGKAWCMPKKMFEIQIVIFVFSTLVFWALSLGPFVAHFPFVGFGFPFLLPCKIKGT